MKDVHVAFVRKLEYLHEEPYLGGGLQPIFDVLEASGIRYEIQAWDDPNVDWETFSHIILTSQIFYVPVIDDFLKWIKKMNNIKTKNLCKLWNPPETILWNYNKKYLLELQSKKIRLPGTILLQDANKTSVKATLEENIKVFQQEGKNMEKLVIKNVICAAGISAWLCRLNKTLDGKLVMADEDLDKLCQQINSPEGKSGVLVQEFLPKIKTEGEWSLVFFDRKFSHALVKRPPGAPQSGPNVQKLENIGPIADDEFRVQVEYGGSFQPLLEKDVPENLKRFSEEVLAEVPGRLLHARIDIVRSDEDEPCLMEVEVLDPDFFLSEKIHAERYVKALLNIYN